MACKDIVKAVKPIDVFLYAQGEFRICPLPRENLSRQPHAGARLDTMVKCAYCGKDIWYLDGHWSSRLFAIGRACKKLGGTVQIDGINCHRLLVCEACSQADFDKLVEDIGYGYIRSGEMVK